MKFDREKPYNTLSLLPPKKNVETRKILRKNVSAGRALAELKGLGESIPNQLMLINTIGNYTIYWQNECVHDMNMFL